MLIKFISFIRDIFNSKRDYDSLEDYISSGNPQTADDVLRLERQFYENRRNNLFTYFHE